MPSRMQILSLTMRQFAPCPGSVCPVVRAALIIMLVYQGRSAHAQVNPDVEPSIEDCIPPSGQEECVSHAEKQLNVTVLLPFDPVYMASMKRVGPAIYLGFLGVRELNLLPGYQINVSYENSNCSNVIAPLKFTKAVSCVSKTVNVFFGPSCELALGMYTCYKQLSDFLQKIPLQILHKSVFIPFFIFALR